MTRDQKNLLLYLGTCLVDYGGKVEARRMNDDDFAQIELWKAEGLIRFGRLFAREAFDADRTRSATHWVLFDDQAWELTHRYRRERADRLTAKVERNDHGQAGQIEAAEAKGNDE